MSDSDAYATLLSPLVEQAIELSSQWHDVTYRKGRWRDAAFPVPEGTSLGVPVISHVVNVGFIVQRAGWDEVSVAAAMLHDSIEDANRHGEELRFGELTALMGLAVAQRVREVTERQYDDDGRPRRWKERKVDYVAALRSASPGGIAVSLADKLHNLWSINASLSRGIDVFRDGPDRRGLSADGPEQCWFYRSVLEASRVCDDPRLVPMRAALEQQIVRFETLCLPDGGAGEDEERLSD